MNAGVWRALALGGHLALLAVVAAWAGWLAEPGQSPRALRLLVGAGPLLLILPGLARGRPRARVIASLLVLAYFTHGVVEAWAGPRHLLGWLELAAASVAFAGCALWQRAAASAARA